MKMTTKFYKEKIQKLQQEMDTQHEMIKHLKNELSHCKESDKDTIISKGNMTMTLPPKFEGKQLYRIMKDREKAIKRLDKKNASNE